MPKVKIEKYTNPGHLQIKDEKKYKYSTYIYQCKCGREIEYCHDSLEKPKKLVRCFECQKKFEERNND